MFLKYQRNLNPFYRLADFFISANGPAVWLVGVRVRVGMRFCKFPVGGQGFRVTMKCRAAEGN